MKIPTLTALLATSLLPAIAQPAADPFLWLEEVTGDRALAWARDQNTISRRALETSPDFKGTYERLLAIYDSKARIPDVSKHGEFFYNFWRDADHVRGIWRRTTLAEYRKAEPKWETVLDLDALGAAEKESWVWKGVNWLRPANDRVLVDLSRGGGDAVVVREFDVTTKSFVKDGFYLPEAKGGLDWRDRDHVYVATDFGPGSMTTSGYARIVKEWTRGTPLSAARVVFEGEKGDVSASANVSNRFGFKREFIRRGITFYTSETHLREGDTFRKLDVPDHANVGTWREFITVTLRKDWTVGGKTYAAGSFLILPWDKFLAGGRDFDQLYTPGPRKSLAGVSTFAHYLVVNELDNVRSRLYLVTRDGTTWKRTALPAPEFGQLGIGPVDAESDNYFLTVTDFVTPTSLYYGTLGREGREQLKQLPAFFNAEGLVVSQHEVVSKDGTRVPYFQVARRGLALDGTAPTLLYGYGGFQLSQTPVYNAGRGAAWFERGGVFILANMRGGGEFGPAWHQAGLKANRQRVYDDFIAIAEDLIKRKVTSPQHLGILGGSNGGLLMGVMLTQRPDLFGAVVCQQPLLDMKRYNHLLAGASWMGEYGNPDLPEEWAYISRYSPYQNVKPGVKYPRILFTTSTRDDRVHPGHARKMAALMLEQKHDVLFYENIEGGHAGAADNKQSAFMNAMAYTFLWKQLR
ncbi:MAG: S9 family peptidase [Verrucomicrobia bacterium]|nr:S9 family peptidase [Verrucomicrobiota bacterium]